MPSPCSIRGWGRRSTAAGGSPRPRLRACKAEGQKLSLSLTNQIVVPVGRTFMAATRARFGNARNNRAMGATPAPPKAPASGV